MIARIPMKPKIARIAAKPKACSSIAWQELLMQMNSKPDIVLVNREHLTEVCECHRIKTDRLAHLPSREEKGRKYISVNRLELFEFVQSHGRVCQ